MGNSQTGIANPLIPLRARAANGEPLPVVEGYVPRYPGTPNLRNRRQAAGTVVDRLRRVFRRGINYVTGSNRNRYFPYPREQRVRAVRLLGLGFTYRQVAAMISPRCSTRTIVRWQRQRVQLEHYIALFRNGVLRPLYQGGRRRRFTPLYLRQRQRDHALARQRIRMIRPLRHPRGNN